jgi:hypothetical protein
VGGASVHASADDANFKFFFHAKSSEKNGIIYANCNINKRNQGIN